ncbi:sperm flagellar protein 1 [Aplysia californica]|uniref:Sperm flagellar protein 1 n=1 Tax=Aplysia californica TaxID=6500 RepID=A0ABM1A7E2_APLCA|nr:sperm flagellar protein 1 [Aplysia californica]
MAAVVKHVDDLDTLNEDELEELYSWVDKIPLSRPKRNINRDFSDGVLAAEVVKHYLPKMIDIHNYTSASSTPQKMQNWHLLNRKVFPKLNFQLTEDLIREICVGKVGLIERFLMHLRAKVERCVRDQRLEADITADAAGKQSKSTTRLHADHRKGRGNMNDKPEADQNLASPGRQKMTQAGPYKGNARIKMMDESVPRAIYEEKEQECLAKEETIQILQAKVRRLEHLLHLKDIRIEDLQTRLESNRPTGLAKR